MSELGHAAPARCSELYPRFSREWRVCVCVNKIGGWDRLPRLLAMYESGVPVREIAWELGLESPSCIYTLLELPAVRARKRLARVSLLDRYNIVRLYRMGYSIPEIAERLGLGRTTVWRILRQELPAEEYEQLKYKSWKRRKQKLGGATL